MLNDAHRLAIFFVGLLWALPARGETLEGRINVGFDAEVLGHRSLTATGDSVREASSSETAVGVGAGSFGLGVGYGVSESFLLRARLGFVSQSRSWDGNALPDTTSSGGGLRLAADFAPGEGAVRPFVGPLLGYELTSSKSQNVEASAASLLMGVQGGLRLFATPSFSVDPGVELAYSTGGAESAGESLLVTGVVFGLHVALNGWLGDPAPAAAPGPAEKSADTEPPGTEDDRAERMDASPPPFSSDGASRKQTIVLEGSARLLLEVADGGVIHYRFISGSADPGDVCRGVAFTRASSTDALPTEGASAVPVGSSWALVAHGEVSPAVLEAARRDRNTVLSACGTDYELDVPARRQMGRVLKEIRRSPAPSSARRPQPPAETQGDGGAP